MSEAIEIVHVESTDAPRPAHIEFSRADMELLKDTVAKGTSDDEFKLFAQVCHRTGLDPFARQIYCVKRSSSDPASIQTSIDGFRLIAQRSGVYGGQDGPYWCGPDGEWTDVWLSSEHPAAAKVGVMRAGFSAPLYRVAHRTEYAQLTKEGKPTRSWRTMPRLMIAKCAEALALRSAFPAELSGLYTADEMEQAGSESPAPVERARQESRRQSGAPSKADRTQAIAALFDLLTDDKVRKAAKDTFVAKFGRPGDVAGERYEEALTFARSLCGADPVPSQTETPSGDESGAEGPLRGKAAQALMDRFGSKATGELPEMDEAATTEFGWPVPASVGKEIYGAVWALDPIDLAKALIDGFLEPGETEDISRNGCGGILSEFGLPRRK